jgi:signal transduction histidine kinase
MTSKRSRERASAVALLAEAEEAERRRLARDLHDVVGQMLTAVGLNLTLVQDAIKDGDAEVVDSRLGTAKELVEKSAKRVREVMDELRPVVLDDYGIVTALKWYGKRFCERTGIDVEVTFEGEELLPRPAVERTFFRIMQEALLNVELHSDATVLHIDVQSEEEGRVLRMSIIDDGCGFEAAEAFDTINPDKTGLAVMAGRAAAVGCAFLVESKPDAGTKVVVEAYLDGA